MGTMRVVGGLVLAAAATLPLRADEPRPAVKDPDSVEALGWLAGCWAGGSSGRAYEEHWMKPAGGVMLGMSRTIAGGKAVGHEFLQIRERARLTQAAGQRSMKVRPVRSP